MKPLQLLLYLAILAGTMNIAIGQTLNAPENLRLATPGEPSEPSEPALGLSVSTIRDGVTFKWEFNCDGKPCQVGRFLDGSPWVRHPSGGNVTFTSVSPNDSSSGLEKNPATGNKAITREQGLLACASSEAPYVSSLDLSNSLPFAAAPDDGVYVKAQRYTGGSCGYTSAADACCVNTYATLTVLDALPPDGKLGAETFRPGMAGNKKTWVTISDLDLSILPSYSEISAGNYDATVLRWMAPYPDFYTGINGDMGRRWTPHARNLPDYAVSRAERNILDMFGTFGTDPLDTAKTSAVYALVRYGIDLYSAYMEGVEWTGGAGQNQGRWHPILYFGALSTDLEIRSNIRQATQSMSTNSDGSNLQFTELYQIRQNVNGIPIWGSYKGADGCSQGGFGGHGRYWADYTRPLRGQTGKGKGTCGDPYGYIDGPAEEPGSWYAKCCSSGVYVSIALAMKIWRDFNDVANNPVMLEFATRLMDGAGWWTQGDQCVAYDPRDTGCNPYTESKASDTCKYFGRTWGYRNGACVTISEASSAGHPNPKPRWSNEYHLGGRPNVDRGIPGVNYWDDF